MRSTDTNRLRRFYTGPFVSAARALRARQAPLLPPGPENSDTTWWEGPSNAPEFLRFDSNTLERELSARWEAEHLPELKPLAREMARLARSLEVKTDEPTDVSPHLYQLY